MMRTYVVLAALAATSFKGLVDAATVVPGLKVELKYATSDNFLHRNVYGKLDRCYLHDAAARKLGITGLGHVEVERITHADIQTGAWKLLMDTRLAGARDAAHTHRAEASAP